MSRVDEIRERAEREVGSKFVGMTAAMACDPAEVTLVAIEFAQRALIAEGRVEKLEGLLNRLAGASITSSDSTLALLATRFICEARTLLADESKENEHGNK